MMWYNDGNEGEVMRKLLDRYETANPGIKIVMDTVAYKDLHNILQGQVEAGTAPDMARVTDVARFAGKYLDMRPYMKNADAWAADWPPAVLQSLRKPEDKTSLCGFPTQFTITGPFINRTLFEQAGVPVPSDTRDKVTWEEWVTAARQVAKATNTPYAVAIDRTGHSFWGPSLSNCAATALTLLINSMAAFALSKYQFRGRDLTFLIIISTLMVPVSVILIPAFLVLAKVGWVNSLWGLIIPGAATPTGVFLLRQYMLTIPDELLDSARIDGASEWRIYWQIILPLAAPALAVLAIFSVMWRWNDFLWPLIVVSKSELFTLQVGLNSFQGELNVQWNYILAMTVLTLLPITLVFAFLERYIATGIATTGMK